MPLFLFHILIVQMECYHFLFRVAGSLASQVAGSLASQVAGSLASQVAGSLALLPGMGIHWQVVVL
jgi:hypothetical protein